MNKKQDKITEKDFFNRVSFALESQHVFANEKQFINYYEIFKDSGINEGNGIKVLDIRAGWGSFSIRLAKMGY